MAHFISLFLLSLGISFGNVELKYPGNSAASSSRTYRVNQISPQGKTPGRTVYVLRNYQVGTVRPMGSGSWDGDKP